MCCCLIRQDFWQWQEDAEGLLLEGGRLAGLSERAGADVVYGRAWGISISLVLLVQRCVPGLMSALAAGQCFGLPRSALHGSSFALG